MTGSRERRAAQRAAWQAAIYRHRAEQRRHRHRKADPIDTARIITGRIDAPSNKAQGEVDP